MNYWGLKHVKWRQPLPSVSEVIQNICSHDNPPRFCVTVRDPWTVLEVHYANTPMQYTAIFHGCKNDNFQMKKCDIFLIFAQIIDCGYTLELRRFLRVPIIYVLKQKQENMYSPVDPSFTI